MASCSTCGFIPRYRRKLSRKDLLSSLSPWNSFGGLPPSFLVSAGGPAGAPPSPPPPLPPPPPPPGGPVGIPLPPPPPPLPPVGMTWTVKPLLLAVAVCAWVVDMVWDWKIGVGVAGCFPLSVVSGGSSVSANSPSEVSTSIL